MHLAIQNAFPNLSLSAEREFIARVQLAGRALGWTVTEVVTSDDVLASRPDMVLATHEFSPKLTEVPTIGVIWSPTTYFEDDQIRVRNILSYDGCLVATPGLREWTRSFFARHGKTAPISTFDFLPTAIDLDEKRPRTEQALFYAGVHWDGKRHGDLFSHLEGRCPMRIYGKAERWKGKTRNYSGTLPFDGTSVVRAIADCGISLALHTDSHRQANVPSMRLFEATAAGAVVIADRMAFAEDNYGDTVLWVDVDRPVKEVADQIIEHVEWVQSHPEDALRLSTRANQVFAERFDLKKQLAKIPAFLDDVVRNMSHPVSSTSQATEALKTSSPPRVDVIMRVGSRPVAFVERALESLAAQSHPNIGLVLVRFRPVDGLDDLVQRYRQQLSSVRVLDVEDAGSRSTALWAGLNATQGKYLCNLDDDDRIHPGHIAGLVQRLEDTSRQVPLAYSGAIEVQEEDGFWFEQPNFRGDLTDRIKERRKLRFMDDFSAERLRNFDNFINSNAWMARRSALTPDLLQDPELQVGEDVYLYLMLLRQGPFAFVPAATADWYWRSKSRDNSMFASSLFQQEGRKLAHLLFKHGALQEIPRSLRPHTDLVSRLHYVVRKPSLLLGPYAPAWRRLRQTLRNRISTRR